MRFAFKAPDPHKSQVARPLGRRFTLWVVAAIAISTCLSFVFAYILYEGSRSTSATERLEAHIQSLRPTIERSLWEVNAASLEAIIEAISARQEVHAIRLFDASIDIQYPIDSKFEGCSDTLVYDLSEAAPYGRPLGAGLLQICLQALPFSKGDLNAITKSSLLNFLGNIAIAAILFILAKRLIVTRLEDVTHRLRERSGPFTVGPDTNTEYPDEIDVLELELAKSTMRLREAAGKLSEAHKMKALGTLTGSVAHEFNNLLAVIQGNLDLLMLLQNSGNPEDLKSCVKDAIGATRSASGLVSELLYFSRPSNKVEVCALGDICDIVRDRIQPFITPNIDVRFVLETKGFVRADKEALERALVNLVKNAIEASPAEGNRISVEMRRAQPSETVKLDGSGGFFALEVRDEGIGVPEDLRPRLFEPFFSTKQEMRGVGLGLWVVYNFCQNSQGSIEYFPMSPGSCFRILLPEERQGSVQVAELDRQIVPGNDFRGYSLLIVDDEEAICNLLRTYFENSGAAITMEKCAKDAVKTIENSVPFDGIVCDYLLPDGTGSEVIAAAKSVSPSTRCIMISGNPDKKAIDDPNLHAVLVKPFNLDELAIQLAV